MPSACPGHCRPVLLPLHGPAGRRQVAPGLVSILASSWQVCWRLEGIPSAKVATSEVGPRQAVIP